MNRIDRCALILLGLLLMVLLPSCNPEAPWATKDVTIKMEMQHISAGFAEYNFSTNKEAYYLVGIEEARPGYEPWDPKSQKPFMRLKLDNANVQYLEWRNRLLKNGEFNIAPFASHSLQYGPVNYFFTGLQRDTYYWVYAFVVNPEKMEPVGKLYIETIKTESESTVDIHFEYRVKGYWDYGYPMDHTGNINSHFPYVAATRDSYFLEEIGLTPEYYFSHWYDSLLNENPQDVNIHYGVTAMENDGLSGTQLFEEGHTYYTCFCGFDGVSDNQIIYGFTWLGDSTSYYFTEKDAL